MPSFSYETSFTSEFSSSSSTESRMSRATSVSSEVFINITVSECKINKEVKRNWGWFWWGLNSTLLHKIFPTKAFFDEIYFHNLFGTCISWTSCSTKVSTCLIKTRWDFTGETFATSMQWMNRSIFFNLRTLIMKWPSKERFCLQRILLPTKNFGFGKLLSEVSRYKYFYFFFYMMYVHVCICVYM